MTKIIISAPEHRAIRIDLDTSVAGARALWGISSIPGVSSFKIGEEQKLDTVLAHNYEVTVWYGICFDANQIAVQLAKLLAGYLGTPFPEIVVADGRNGAILAQSIKVAQRLEGGDDTAIVDRYDEDL